MSIAGSDDDEFEFTELTESDWERVAQIEARHRPSSPTLARGVNLFRQFRANKRLSVSDLVGPQWCEVKFDYSLRWGTRYQRVETKPSTIKTARGKIITVKKVVAERNEVVMDKGTDVHRVLEHAITPYIIHVPVTNVEEQWGSKLLTMLTNINLLTSLGYCREFPVMGFINNILISGVIDEISRQPIKATIECPPASTSECEQKDTWTTHLSTQVTHHLFLIDNKTRGSDTVPPASDQGSSRLQLMLYKRLLDRILHIPSFRDTFSRLPIDLHLTFSPPFLQAMQLLDISDTAREGLCINDLAQAWEVAVKGLQIDKNMGGAISSDLTLVYRTRNRGGQKRRGASLERGETDSIFAERKRTTNTWPLYVTLEDGECLASSSTLGETQSDQRVNDTGEGQLPPHLAQTRVDHGEVDPFTFASSDGLPNSYAATHFVADFDETSFTLQDGAAEVKGPQENLEDFKLAWAIQESLKPQYAGKDESELAFGASYETLTGSIPGEEPYSASLSIREDSPRPVRPSTLDAPQPDSGSNIEAIPISSGASVPDHLTSAEESKLPHIIGTSRFQYDSKQLDAYLEDVMAFWLGKREAKGVDVEDSNRCNVCEFRDGCEWREAKATEFLENARVKRKAKRAAGKAVNYGNENVEAEADVRETARRGRTPEPQGL